jgi:hypothetical protein
MKRGTANLGCCHSPKLCTGHESRRLTTLQGRPHAVHFKPILDFGEGQVVDRGAYVRVLVPQYCVVTRSAIETHLGRSFRFPGELETVMSAFKGSLQLNQDDAAWRCADPNFLLKPVCFCSRELYGAPKDILASSAAKTDAN